VLVGTASEGTIDMLNEQHRPRHARPSAPTFAAEFATAPPSLTAPPSFAASVNAPIAPSISSALSLNYQGSLATAPARPADRAPSWTASSSGALADDSTTTMALDLGPRASSAFESLWSDQTWAEAAATDVIAVTDFHRRGDSRALVLNVIAAAILVGAMAFCVTWILYH
jgi:hypothetical protein